MSICKECKKEIVQREGEPISETKRKIFCNSSCSASFNNRTCKLKGDVKKTQCPRCGKKKHETAPICQKCKSSDSFEEKQREQMGLSLRSGPASVRYAYIRQLAKKAMIRYGVEKKCVSCGFDIVLEVCHRKPLASFPREALIGEVNSKENLIYLCPNHHVMFDKGLLEL